MNKSKSRQAVLWVYLAALGTGAILTYYLQGNDPLGKLFFIDVMMTVVVFIFSYKYSNASLYDPYWSVIPFAMFFYWLYIFGPEVISIKILITAFIISFWSWRLTGNWLRGWKGMEHEDWRYIQLKQQTGKWYMMVNFLGIHMFPTLVVFVAAMPLYYIFLFSSEMNWVTYVGFTIAIGGTLLEMVADNQLHKFKIKENNPIAVMRFGVWRYLRHPNYLGEILFWVGLMLISYTPYTTISVAAGSILMLAMFVFISIPLIDKRLLKSKPGYEIYKQSTWALFPKLTIIKKPLSIIIVVLALVSCDQKEQISNHQPDVFLVVLGITQDAGYPQAGCNKTCCTKVWQGDVKPEKVISLGLVDRPNNKVYMFDATPDFKEQLHNLLAYLPQPDINSLGGIFLTHAHIGHYTGLMQLGHEAMGASHVPVFAMPRMHSYLQKNGPWSQLVSYKNIDLIQIANDSIIHLSNSLTVKPLLVPHRDEYSETVGFRVGSSTKSFLFIPDIDKWHKWDRDIIKEVESVDYAFLDAAFYSVTELPNRDMSEIPHPFAPETIELFKSTQDDIKQKLIFIHLNHTNPLLHNGKEYQSVLEQGYNVGREGIIYDLD